MGCPRPKFFFLVYQIFCLKKSDCPWFLFSLESITPGEITSGELPKLEAGSAIVLKHRKWFCSRTLCHRQTNRTKWINILDWWKSYKDGDQRAVGVVRCWFLPSTPINQSKFVSFSLSWIHHNTPLKFLKLSLSNYIVHECSGQF